MQARQDRVMVEASVQISAPRVASMVVVAGMRRPAGGKPNSHPTRRESGLDLALDVGLPECNRCILHVVQRAHRMLRALE